MVVWLLLTCLAIITNIAAGKEVVTEFKVVPNKPGKIEVALDTPPIESSICKFEWDSSGATVEVCLPLLQLIHSRPTAKSTDLAV